MSLGCKHTMGGTRKCLISRGTPAFTWHRDINRRQSLSQNIVLRKRLVYAKDISAKTVSKTMMKMSGI